ncbi:MAG: beta-ketoacyl-[acyl-carrier-protein] synthase family protein [Planctomycetia bacterium]|nr:beta-ketoacyl-[acyl-carrier-protein] synthase family protein [Planctomycetia bacterium]
MQAASEVVITGLGVVSPIGIGCDPFWDALAAGTSGIRPIDRFDSSSLLVRFGGQIPDFDPKLYVRPRKSLKIMSREIQLGVAAADLAVSDAGIAPGTVQPDRFGVVFGNDMIYADLEDLEGTYRRSEKEGRFDFGLWSEAIQEELHPLWLLKHLPNMTASHIAIAHDARGPNNSIVLGDVSSLLAVAEAASVIQRGWADVMLTGGTGCRLHPTALVARGDALLSHRADDFRRACRPFDRDRDGLVNGEGAAVIVLESRTHAERRGAEILGRLLAWASRCEPRARRQGVTGTSLRQAIRATLSGAGFGAEDVGHVNAHGVGTIEMDRAEAAAISAELGAVPVTAPKSLFGHLGAGGGAVELAASVLGLGRGLVPPTLNHDTPDPACPVNVVTGAPLAGRVGTAVAVNFCSTGQAAAVAIAEA